MEIEVFELLIDKLSIVVWFSLVLINMEGFFAYTLEGYFATSLGILVFELEDLRFSSGSGYLLVIIWLFLRSVWGGYCYLFFLYLNKLLKSWDFHSLLQFSFLIFSKGIQLLTELFSCSSFVFKWIYLSDISIFLVILGSWMRDFELEGFLF